MSGAASTGLLGLLGLHDLAVFCAAVLVLNATPGVDLLLTVTRTLQGGARAGVATALGIAAGCAVHTVAAALGLAALLAVSAWAFDAIRWAGALYLMWLALGMLRGAWGARYAAPADGVPGTGAGGRAVVTWRADARRGLLTNVLNPKVALFVLAFLPQFIAPDAARPGLAFVALGVLFVAQGLAFLLGVVLLVRHLRQRQGAGTAPWVARGLQAAGGVAMAGLALRLVATARGPVA